VQAKKKSAPQPRKSILIADDSADTVLTLGEILRDEGYVVHTCTNATFVIEAVERYKPDICILDIVMPGRTGFSLVREIIAMNLAKRPVLIAMSAVFNKASERPLLYSAGFDHVMPKPADPQELLQLIDEVGGGEPPAAA
jgi:CheY-like chemotaxis protein